MNLNGQSRSIQLLKELKRRISTDSQVLLVCHKDSEHWYSSQEHDFRNFEVTHWVLLAGKITGRILTRWLLQKSHIAIESGPITHSWPLEGYKVMNGSRILLKEHSEQSMIFKEDFNYHKSRYQFFKPLTESDADVLLMYMRTANPLKFIFLFLMKKREKRSLTVYVLKCH